MLIKEVNFYFSFFTYTIIHPKLASNSNFLFYLPSVEIIDYISSCPSIFFNSQVIPPPTPGLHVIMLKVVRYKQQKLANSFLLIGKLMEFTSFWDKNATMTLRNNKFWDTKSSFMYFCEEWWVFHIENSDFIYLLDWYIVNVRSHSGHLLLKLFCVHSIVSDRFLLLHWGNGCWAQGTVEVCTLWLNLHWP